MKKLTVKQEKFVDEYIANGGNGSAAARQAGYSAKGANVTAAKLLAITSISQEIAKRLAEMRNAKTAELKEVLEFLTGTMRGEISEKIPMTVGNGKSSHVEVVEVPTRTRERLRAAENLAKIFGAYRETDNTTNIPNVIRIVRANSH